MYLRPWILARGLATKTVPFITDLAEYASQQESTATGQDCRRGWKKYIEGVLPHAERGIRSFMLTCLAEGRGGDFEDDDKFAKGLEIVCKLSLHEVHAAVLLQQNKSTETDETYIQQLVIRAAQQAASLSQLSPGFSGKRCPAGQIFRLHQEVRSQIRQENVEKVHT